MPQAYIALSPRDDICPPDPPRKISPSSDDEVRCSPDQHSGSLCESHLLSSTSLVALTIPYTKGMSIGPA